MQLRPGVYPIVDVGAITARGLDVLRFAGSVIAARPQLVQLRAKGLGGRETLALLRALSDLCRADDVRLVANDRPDLAVLAGVGTVHVGQDDVPLSEVRRFAPGLAVGVSTHSLAQLDAALAKRPDYVAFGPVFATTSKQGADAVVGLEALSEAVLRARAVAVPLVAIGGIDVARAPDVARTGALGAVIGALFPEGASLAAVTERVRELDVLLGASR